MGTTKNFPNYINSLSRMCNLANIPWGKHSYLENIPKVSFAKVQIHLGHRIIGANLPRFQYSRIQAFHEAKASLGQTFQDVRVPKHKSLWHKSSEGKLSKCNSTVSLPNACLLGPLSPALCAINCTSSIVF